MSEKILLVDDDRNILFSYRRYLQSKFEVLIAGNGDEGIAVLKERGPFAVVVSDYRMPGMDGIQFFSLAHQIAPDTVRIMLTGHADLEGAISAVNKGNVFRFLTKPCPVKVLLETVMTGVEQYRTVRNERELVNKTLKHIHFEESGKKRAEEELDRITKKFRSFIESAIHSMAMVVEKRDPYTANHQRRVALLAVAIAREMELAEEEIEGIYMAATIHDIGKIYVPAEILNKTGKLNDIEFALIRSHPQVGYEILKLIDFPWPVEKIVVQHHERLNGSGYPGGLFGEEILLSAKILCVADVVEAMTSHRPYKQALGLDKALEEILQNRGILYDKKVVDACLKLFKAKAFAF
jgi:putative nucleotidyltransferase with HDIG domain